MDLMGPGFNQQSFQKLKGLLCPGIHLIPCLNISSPFFNPFQVDELGSLAEFLEVILC